MYFYFDCFLLVLDGHIYTQIRFAAQAYICFANILVNNGLSYSELPVDFTMTYSSRKKDIKPKIGDVCSQVYNNLLAVVNVKFGVSVFRSYYRIRRIQLIKLKTSLFIFPYEKYRVLYPHLTY